MGGNASNKESVLYWEVNTLELKPEFQNSGVSNLMVSAGSDDCVWQRCTSLYVLAEVYQLICTGKYVPLYIYFEMSSEIYLLSAVILLD